MSTVYFDNSATTRPTDFVMQKVIECMKEGYFNPSALYKPAFDTEQQLEKCRELIKEKVGADKVVFTSGGTEANNLAIFGSFKRRREKGIILYSAGEHPSVIQACLQMQNGGFQVQAIPYTSQGLIDLSCLEDLITNELHLACIMQVNNETGAIQPLYEAVRLVRAKAPDAHIHVDGVQGFLRVPINIRTLGINSYSLSGHKIHALKGIGALALSKDSRLSPMFFGGEQENKLRSGTENVPGIVSLMAAIASFPETPPMMQLKSQLFKQLKEAIPSVSVNGPAPDSPCAAPHILNVSFPPVRSQTMLHTLEADEVYVGTGSACSAKKQQISHVLQSMGTSQSIAESSIRLSLGLLNTQADVDKIVDCIAEAYNQLKHFVRR
jgi:cysteine desulfurase